MQFPNIALRFRTAHNSTLDHRAHYKRRLFLYGCSTGLFRGNKFENELITRGIKVPAHEGSYDDAGTCRSNMLKPQNHVLFMHRGHVCVYTMWLCRCIMSQLHVPATCPSYMSLLDVPLCKQHMIYVPALWPIVCGKNPRFLVTPNKNNTSGKRCFPSTSRLIQFNP